jgi:hypothetical protein
MRVYFATWLEEPAQREGLNKKGAIFRLLSFHFILKRKNPSKELQDYLK